MNKKIKLQNYKLSSKNMAETKQQSTSAAKEVENTTCAVCWQDFNGTSRSKVHCGHCETDACKECVRRYLISSSSTAHCMECKNKWDRSFTMNAIGKSYYNKQYKDKRKDLLFEVEKARFPESMPAVEKYREVPGMIEIRDKLSEEIAELEHKLYMAKRRHRYLNRDINDAKNAVNGTSSSGEEKKEAKKFIRQCPSNDCNGYLSTQWKCGVCKIWACPKCFEEIGFDKNAEHTCDPSAVASAELIKKETKPCPSCGTRIFKINGCDQMWCTSCKVAFSWKTGRRVNGVIHNPHYYAFQRMGNSAVVRNPGAVVCGGLPEYNMFRRNLQRFIGADSNKMLCYLQPALKNLIKSRGKEEFLFYKRFYRHYRVSKEADKYLRYFSLTFDGLMRFIHRGARHLQHTVIDVIRTNLQNNINNNLLRVQYICKEITEREMKIQLLKKDKAREKARACLDVYELLMTVYVDVLNNINEKVAEFNEYVSQATLHSSADKVLGASKMQKILKESHLDFIRIENVRKYCNEQLCLISVNYSQVVEVTNNIYGTRKINKKVSKELLSTKKDIGEYGVLG